MGLSLIAIVVGAVAVLSLLIGFALALLAEGSEDNDPDAGVLVKLSALRSPSGRPFFATPQAVQDFVQTLDDSREERGRG